LVGSCVATVRFAACLCTSGTEVDLARSAYEARISKGWMDLACTILHVTYTLNWECKGKITASARSEASLPAI
jgi:hypothetical protein